MTTCIDCKFYNIDNKDGFYSTGYEYCELNVIDARQIEGSIANHEICDRYKPRIKCHCPYNLKERKKFYGEDQHFP